MALAAVSCHAVQLLKALAAELTGEAQGSCCLRVLAPVPVQRGLLAAGEPTDFTPKPGTAEETKGLQPCWLPQRFLLPPAALVFGQHPPWLQHPLRTPSPAPMPLPTPMPPHSLQGLLSSVDAPVDDQVAASAEGPGTELTDVISGVCRHRGDAPSSTPGCSPPQPPPTCHPHRSTVPTLQACPAGPCAVSCHPTCSWHLSFALTSLLCLFSHASMPHGL